MKEKMELLVTVYCLTYNHEKYIRDTFEGILSQKKNFEINIFVYDDASNDGTSLIVKEYAKKYPELFDVYISPVNMYNSPKRNALMKELEQKYIKGKYVAWCEGDDYWIDSQKLQKQIDFLEKHDDVAMVSHGSIWLNCTDNACYEYRPYHENKYLSAEEVIIQANGNIPTASLVMRSDILLSEKQFPGCDIGDHPLQLLALSKGKIYYFDKIMSVYRYMHSGSWSECVSTSISKKALHDMKMIKFYILYNKYTQKKFNQFIKYKIVEYLKHIVQYKDGELTYGEFMRVLGSLDSSIDRQYAQLIEYQRHVYQILSHKPMEYKEYQKYSKYDHIVIYGNGVYGQYLKKYFDRNNIKIEGYIVSDNRQYKKMDELKPIWGLDEYPFNYKDSLVCIAVNQHSEDEIRGMLRLYNIDTIDTPFWFDFE